MGHDHNRNHSHLPAQDSTRAIRIAFLLNLAFTIIEIIGGYWTNSLAILADALHDLGDSATLGLSWQLERYSRRRKDAHFSYGYRRFSLLAALFSTVILIAGSLLVLSEAIPRLLNPEHSNASGMLLFALLGIAVNGLAAFRLRQSRSMNARVVAWHLIEDVLGWVAVLIVSVALLVADIHFLDPLLSILITLYVLYNVVNNLRKTLTLFLQGVPEGLDLYELEKRLLAIPKVHSAHHIHVWSLDGENHVLTAHVVVDGNSTRDDVLAVKSGIRAVTEDFEVAHTTLEVEFEGEDCHMKDTHLD